MLELMIAAMLAIAGGEIHNIDTPEQAGYRAGVAELVRINIEVGAEGMLVSPEVDPVLLTVIQWYEARLRPNVKDGDCRMVGLGHSTRKVCSVQGPMQLMKGASKLPMFLGTRFEGMSNPEMKKPENNIPAAYQALGYYKELCGGPPGVWITAYGFGHCPKRSWGGRYIGLHWEGVRRCAMLTAILEHTGAKPEDWRCGHEGQSVLSHTRYLIRQLRKSAPTKPVGK